MGRLEAKVYELEGHHPSDMHKTSDKIDPGSHHITVYNEVKIPTTAIGARDVYYSSMLQVW